ncbi:Bursicon alpha [Frankliniella occidentalis]|uniref:Bursicon n=1 Tax=Frankliniella occidentalis TaxID=133901 RepID=A0A6J1SI17_FRAOC|nr:bursicon isoform X1 [Frankliniella occidentalis]KAE8747318.1 Bursicon alpha [Frankliniella occidentalis]
MPAAGRVAGRTTPGAGAAAWWALLWLGAACQVVAAAGAGAGGGDAAASGSTPNEECQVTPVIHVLQYPGCVPKPIPSFACTGRCSSYLQVSGSKIWQMERSCMCCQESGEREASVSLFCPKAKPGERKFRKVSTKAPLECMCRPCTGVEESAIIPQEIAGYADEGPLSHHFRTSS